MLEIRLETADDILAVRAVHRLAFGQEDEAALVDALRDGGYGVASLVAEDGGRIVGHIFFSRMPIEAGGRVIEVAALVPGMLDLHDATVRYAPPFGIEGG